MQKSVLYTSLFTTLLLTAGSVQATTATTSIPVTATVSPVCTVSTTAALAFAVYDPININAVAALQATGAISVACSKGSSGVTIGLDSGAHVSGVQRQMIGGTSTNLLSYNIYQPTTNAASSVCTFPGTILWTNSGAGMLTIPSAPAKTARTFNVCGMIPGGQDVSADNYNDTVTATITF